MMNVLYDKKVERADCYTYKINGGGTLRLKSDTIYSPNGYDVEILFVDGELSKVNVSEIHDLRTKWYVMGAIAEQIKLLEDHYD